MKRHPLNCGCGDCEFARITKAEQDACDLEDVPQLRARISELEATLADGRAYLDRVVKERSELGRLGDAMEREARFFDGADVPHFPSAEAWRAARERKP